jgi:hypothetical protein
LSPEPKVLLAGHQLLGLSLATGVSAVGLSENEDPL